MRLILLVSIICLLSYSQSPAQMYRQLIGTWKHESREIYEKWTFENDSLTGYGYELKDGQEKITETLRLWEAGDRVIYEATVTNQNQGKPVQFVLNEEETGRLQFENPAHDFPRKIIYEFLSPDRIRVHVLGENDNGFDFYLKKIE